MDRLRRRWFGFLALLLLVGAAPAAAQEGPAGRWAVRAGGQTLILIELRPDAASPGGWTGMIERPRHFSTMQTLAFLNVRGPVVRSAVSVRPEGDGALLLTAPVPQGEPDRYRFRQTGSGSAELALADLPAGITFPPMILARAGAAESVATDWEPGRSYPMDVPRSSNPEMRAIFEADQAARAGASIDWAVVGPQDEARRRRTHELLDAGALSSGEDFHNAAFIFQHGGTADDYLLAHTLAMVAVARGRADATWIAAATLDRYLQAIGRPQIYGTQYRTPEGVAATQEPYDRALVSDALRAALGVPPQADQEARRVSYGVRPRPAGH